MAQLTTAYTPGGIQTTTSAPPSAGSFGLDPHLQQIADQIMNMRLEQAKRQERAQQEAEAAHMETLRRTTGDAAPADAYRQWLASGGIQGHTPAASNTGMMGGGGGNGASGTIQQQMQAIALQDAQQQVAAKSKRAPTRTVTGANIIPGETVDPLQMTGYDRAAQLPGNAVGDKNF